MGGKSSRNTEPKRITLPLYLTIKGTTVELEYFNRGIRPYDAGEMTATYVGGEGPMKSEFTVSFTTREQLGALIKEAGGSITDRNGRPA